MNILTIYLTVNLVLNVGIIAQDLQSDGNDVQLSSDGIFRRQEEDNDVVTTPSDINVSTEEYDETTTDFGEILSAVTESITSATEELIQDHVIQKLKEVKLPKSDTTGTEDNNNCDCDYDVIEDMNDCTYSKRCIKACQSVATSLTEYSCELSTCEAICACFTTCSADDDEVTILTQSAKKLSHSVKNKKLSQYGAYKRPNSLQNRNKRIPKKTMNSRPQIKTKLGNKKGKTNQNRVVSKKRRIVKQKTDGNVNKILTHNFFLQPGHKKRPNKQVPKNLGWLTNSNFFKNIMDSDDCKEKETYTKKNGRVYVTLNIECGDISGDNVITNNNDEDEYDVDNNNDHNDGAMTLTNNNYFPYKKGKKGKHGKTVKNNFYGHKHGKGLTNTIINNNYDNGDGMTVTKNINNFSYKKGKKGKHGKTVHNNIHGNGGLTVNNINNNYGGGGGTTINKNIINDVSHKKGKQGKHGKTVHKNALGNGKGFTITNNNYGGYNYNYNYGYNDYNDYYNSYDYYGNRPKGRPKKKKRGKKKRGNPFDGKK